MIKHYEKTYNTLLIIYNNTLNCHDEERKSLLSEISRQQQEMDNKNKEIFHLKEKYNKQKKNIN